MKRKRRFKKLNIHFIPRIITKQSFDLHVLRFLNQEIAKSGLLGQPHKGIILQLTD